MKIVSLRQFRDSIADHTEAVQVVRRGPDGFETLGTWTPASVGVPVLVREVAAGFGRPTAAPKPVRKSR